MLIAAATAASLSFLNYFRPRAASALAKFAAVRFASLSSHSIG